MLTFSTWLKERHFYVREMWDVETSKMVGAGYLVLMPHQEKILDEALKINPDTGYFYYETLLYSAIKKSGKTAIVAAIGSWYLEEVGPAGTEAFCIANDLDSAEGRVMKDMKYHFKQRIEKHDTFFNNRTGREMRYTDKNTSITAYNITLPNESFVTALAQSYKSVAGSRHAITLWDELWGNMSELSHRVWDEMTPIPTVPNSLRVIGTYAGFENESDLLWDLYLQGVGTEEHEQGKAEKIFEDLPVYVNRRLFTYWDHEPRMPWQTPEYYDQQMESLRPAAFLRLHMNQWVTSHESFIPVEWWDTAAKSYHAPATLWDDHPYRHFPMTIAVDGGIMRDSTALIATAYDSKRGKVGMVCHKIWIPQPGDQIDLDMTVEKELVELYNKFNVVAIRYDPTHLMQTMLRLKQRGFPCEPFQQTRPNMIQASQFLYELLKNRNLEAYPDEDMRKHLQMAVAETTSGGFRIVKNKANKKHKVDGAVALAMSAYCAVKSGGVDISIPVVIGSPFSDATAWTVPSDELYIPYALQTEE